MSGCLAVAQGPLIFWQRPARLSFFDPTLLICEKKRGVEPPRRSCGELLRCGAAPQKGRGPFEILVVRGCLCSNNQRVLTVT